MSVQYMPSSVAVCLSLRHISTKFGKVLDITSKEASGQAMFN